MLYPLNLYTRFVPTSNHKHVGNGWQYIRRAHVCKLVFSDTSLTTVGTSDHLSSYKKCINNQKKTGRGRKYFEYKEEMDVIFKGNKKIKPSIILTTDTKDKEIEPNRLEAIPST